MIRHHPDDTYLAAYASGQLGEAESLVIAAHAAFCPHCHAAISSFEHVGGCLLEDEIPIALCDDALDHLIMQLAETPQEPQPTPASENKTPKTPDFISGVTLPTPLRQYIERLDPNTNWQAMIKGLDYVPLQVGQRAQCKTKLLRIRAGAVMPQHSHDGEELTLVLRGAFSDSRGWFGPGDLACTDQDVDHKPVADSNEDCICLVVTTDNLRLTGTLTKFLNPFIRF